MTPELRRWTDERLDDLAKRVEDNTRQQDLINQLRTDVSTLKSDLSGIVATLRTELRGVGGDTVQCITELRDLKVDLKKREEVQHDERRADRRWMIGTLLTTAGLVIAALAIFLG